MGRVFTRPWVTRRGHRLLDLSACRLGSHISLHVPVQVRLLYGPNAGTKQTHTKRRVQPLDANARWKSTALFKGKKKSLNEEIDSLHFSFSVLGRLDFVPIFLRPPLCLFPLSPALCRGILVNFFPLSGYLHIPFKAGHMCCCCLTGTCSSLRVVRMMCTLHLCPSDTTPHAYGCTSARMYVLERVPAGRTCLQPVVQITHFPSDKRRRSGGGARMRGAAWKGLLVAVSFYYAPRCHVC